MLGRLVRGRAGSPSVRRNDPASVIARAAAAVLALVACIAAARLSARFIPYDMDEFIHYRALACVAFPQSRELTGFDESCRSLELTLPFTSTPLPLRSYAYNGSLPSLVYWPFWALLDDPVSSRVQGFFFLTLLVPLIARVAGTHPLSALLAVFVLPSFLFSLIVDLGATGFSLIAGTSAILCMLRALNSVSGPSQALWGVAAGLSCARGRGRSWSSRGFFQVSPSGRWRTWEASVSPRPRLVERAWRWA